MYDNKTALEILADVLYTNGIDQIVCSGNLYDVSYRFNQDSRFSTSHKSDRRSAGYFAMGLAQRTNNIVWLFCEGNNAGAVDVLPALTEAQNQNVPMVVCSIGSIEFVSNTCSLLRDKCRICINVDIDRLNTASELLCDLYRSIAAAIQFDKGPVLLCVAGNLERKLECNEAIQRVSVITQEYFYDTIKKTKEQLEHSKICVFFDPLMQYEKEMVGVVYGFLREFDVAVYQHDAYKLRPYIESTIKEGVDYDILISFSDSLPEEANTELYQIKAREKWLVSTGGCSSNVRYGFNRYYLCGSELFMRAVSKQQEPIVSDSFTNENSNNTLLETALSGLVASFAGQVNVFYGYDVRNLTSDILAHHKNVSSACYASLQGGEGTLSVLLGQSIIYESLINICVLSVSEFLRDMNAIHIRHYKDNVRIIVVAKENEEDTVLRLKSWLLDYNIESMDVKNKESLETAIKKFTKRDGRVYTAFIEE